MMLYCDIFQEYNTTIKEHTYNAIKLAYTFKVNKTVCKTLTFQLFRAFYAFVLQQDKESLREGYSAFVSKYSKYTCML